MEITYEEYQRFKTAEGHLLGDLSHQAMGGGGI
jgi:hypothetical protein